MHFSYAQIAPVAAAVGRQRASTHCIVEQHADDAAAAMPLVGLTVRDQYLRTLRRRQLAFEDEPTQ